MNHPISNNGFWWAAISLTRCHYGWQKSLEIVKNHFRSIAGIKHPTMSVWLPFCVNKHTNILLWLAERGNEPSYIESCLLWLLVGKKIAIS